ncbi:MAG: DNA cytosine methyltransferase [Dehalococcoidia bacterium]|nr:DNA cytosine methyltransferase [Dehalococcoidia bacterium]
MADNQLTSVEICAGAGGQALGLEKAGFAHLALVEIDPHACATLRHNRPEWNVIHGDVTGWSGSEYAGVDLLAGGVPCPPFSKAGLQLGKNDERDLFPTMLRLVEEIEPRAVMIENVRGLLDRVFDDYREEINLRLRWLGYSPSWRLLHASDFGVPQLRPRVICVAMKDEYASAFRWPEPGNTPPPTVGEVLLGEMKRMGWKGADEWASRANQIAPTLVGGSKKHGGPDLGPTRARKAWAALGVNGKTVAAAPPPAEFIGDPSLTVQMAALIQGFPAEWQFTGAKTSSYKQVGNAFPPPVAQAVGNSIRVALNARDDPTQQGVETSWQLELVPAPSFAHS